MQAYSPQDYRSGFRPTWCKGCSYYGVLVALSEVFAEKQIDPHRLNVVSGIGCSSRMALYLNTFGLHTLHGRAIPVAVGSRLANPDIRVIVAAGDGDFFSIGIGHFVHAARKNFDMTVICMDNRMYAMTKNQASPTSVVGYCGSLTPYGKLSVPLNVLEFAIACDATFVSRTFAGSQKHMQEMFARAIDHQGFSFVEVIAPCRTFDRNVTLASLLPRMVDINRDYRHDTSDKKAALAAAVQALDYDASDEVEIPIGIFWENRAPTFEERIAHIRKSVKKKATLPSILKKYSL
jgi:2-oxoglutarate ferredoxin oxidoreductase subunit beta